MSHFSATRIPQNTSQFVEQIKKVHRGVRQRTLGPPQDQIAARQALGEIVGEIGEIIGIFEDSGCLEDK